MGRGIKPDGGKELSEVSTESVMIKSQEKHGKSLCLGHFRQKEPQGQRLRGRRRLGTGPSCLVTYCALKGSCPSLALSSLQHSTAQYIFLKHFCTVGPLLQHRQYCLFFNTPNHTTPPSTFLPGPSHKHSCLFLRPWKRL